MTDAQILQALKTPLAMSVIKSLVGVAARESVKVTREELKNGSITEDEMLSPEEAAKKLKLTNKAGELRSDYKRTLTQMSIDGKIKRYKDGKKISYSKNSIIKHINDNSTQTFKPL